MSYENNDDERPGHKQVVDDEGTVDQKLKNEILRARNRVEDREDRIFVQGPLEGVPYNREQLTRIWQTSVRQYLRRVEPLLQSKEIRGAQEYYRDKTIADRAVYPEDGETPVQGGGSQDTVAIQWSQFYHDGVDLDRLRQIDERFGRQFTPPEPKRYRLQGLRAVIERPEQTFEWSVPLGNSVNPLQNMVAVPSTTVTPTKHELERAVRLTDLFLQEKAGIAIDVGHQEKDERELNPV